MHAACLDRPATASAPRVTPARLPHTAACLPATLACPPPMQAWVRVFDQCMWGMIFFHLLMVGILGLKESIGAPILVAILWIFDLVFW